MTTVMAHMKGNLTSTDCRERSHLDVLVQGPSGDLADEMEGCCSDLADNFEMVVDRELAAAHSENAPADKDLYSILPRQLLVQDYTHQLLRSATHLRLP